MELNDQRGDIPAVSERGRDASEGSESVLLALDRVIGVLWFTTTLRHAIVPATTAPARVVPATSQTASGLRRDR